MILLRKKRLGWIAGLVLLSILAILSALLAWGSPIHAAEAESHSHTSSSVACPKCGKPLTVVGTKETSCSLRGYTEYNCDECNQYHEIIYEDLAPHTWKQIASTAPTCTEAGTITRRCTVCSATERVEHGTALGHNYQTEVIAPTCSSIGYTLHTCTRCGDSYQTDQVGTTKHTYSQTVITEPTCHSVGHLRNVCLVCGQYTTEEIPMVEHSWKTEVVEATHESQGYTIYTCQYEGCGTVKREDFTDPLPYDMIWTEQIPATCTSNGVKVGHCADGCGHTETVVLPHLGHDFGDWETVYEASKDSDGLERRVCSRCQHTETQTVKYDPRANIAQAEPIDPLMLGVFAFLLLIAIGVIVLCFLLLMEHARRDTSKRKRKLE